MKNKRIRVGFHWIIFIASLVFIEVTAAAEMVARLPQVMQPNFIAFTDQRVYVVEQSSQVQLYGRGPNGIVFEKTFGQVGEGPGEFDFIHHIRV